MKSTGFFHLKNVLRNFDWLGWVARLFVIRSSGRLQLTYPTVSRAIRLVSALSRLIIKLYVSVSVVFIAFRTSLTRVTDLVTASKDHSVGVYRLGPPSHGFTEYSEVR